MSVIDDVKARIDAVALYSETVKLRKSGRAFMGLCPFHAHKSNTPSFAVWPDTGYWKCFGQCNDGGDIFKFIMKRDGVDFADALRALAERAGVELQPRAPVEQARDDQLARLRQLLEAAATWYAHLLQNAPQAQHARAHLAQRGLGSTAIEMFQLGYSLSDWDAGLKYFTAKGYTPEELLAAGLIIEKEGDLSAPAHLRRFDRFRDRLMIPVRDERGRMTGFQARALQADALPKFMNSPQTALFDKGKTLFGLHLARKPIREAEAAIVVEGNLDAIAAHQAGFANVVSSQGTAITEHQLRALKKQTKRIILCLDADEAGAAATLRGLSVAREALDREAEIAFDPHGLVKTEGHLGADLRVMTLPDGLDPDDVIKRDPEEWRRLVAEAEPVVAYVIKVLTTGRDVRDPKVKTEIAQTVLPLIDDVAQPIERDAYRQQLARVLRVEWRDLAVKPTGPTRRMAPPRATPPLAAPAPDSASPPETAPAARVKRLADDNQLEAYCLRVLLRYPELLYRLDRELQNLGLNKLSPSDFLATDLQQIFTTLAQALAQVDADPRDFLSQNLAMALWPKFMELLSEPEAYTVEIKALKVWADSRKMERSKVEVLPATEEKALEALLSTVLRLRRHLIKRWVTELQALAEEISGEELARYNLEVSQQVLAKNKIDLALSPHKRAPAALPRWGRS